MSTSNTTPTFRPLAKNNGGDGSTAAAAAQPTSSLATSIYDPSNLTKVENVENNSNNVVNLNNNSNNNSILVGNPQPPITLDSVDFMNYLATEIDISKLVVETKDGQRISANFSGSRFPDGVATPPPVPVFKSLDALKSIDSSIDGASTNTKKTPPAVETGTGTATAFGGQSYLQPLKGSGDGTNDTNTVSTTEPPMPGSGSLSRLSSLGTLGSWDPFASSDWSKEYGGTHVEVKYTSAFDLKSTDFLTTAGGTAGRGQPAASAAATGPFQKRLGKNGKSATAATKTVSGREGMFLDPKFDNSLNPLLVAAARMADQSTASRSTDHGSGVMTNGMNRIGGIPVVSATTATATGGAGYHKTSGTAAGPYTLAQQQQQGKKLQEKRPRKRKSRKIIPKVKEYVVFTDKDILFGRGGRSNHHPGNKTYRDLVTSKQPYYRTCEKTVKTQVAQSIVDYVQEKLGGRFLELDKETDRWYVVPNIVARRKVGQALREDNTVEARAVKRQKYLGKFKDGDASQSSTVSNGNSTAPAGSALATTRV